MESPVFGLRLFGFNINEVNEELSQVEREFYETRCNLELKTSKYLDENQKLKEEIRALKRSRGSSALQPEFLEAAVRNSGQFIELYKDFVSGETERLKEKEQRITQLYNEKLAVIDREIKSTQKIIALALESIMNKAAEISLDDLMDEEDSHSSVPEIAEIADVKPVDMHEPDVAEKLPLTEPVQPEFVAPESEEIASASAVEETIKAALSPDAPQSETPSKEAFWGPIPKIEFISPIEPEDFEEIEKAPPPVAAPPVAPTPSPSPPPVLQSFKLSIPPLQTETKKPASD